MGNKRMAATVITIAVEKGGCGKTVTTSNLAYLMGDEGKKVLCLDTDPQGNLTFALTGGNAITRSIWPAIPTCWTISCARSRTSTIIS